MGLGLPGLPLWRRAPAQGLLDTQGCAEEEQRRGQEGEDDGTRGRGLPPGLALLPKPLPHGGGGGAGVSQGWNARQDPWEALGSTVHLDKGGRGLVWPGRGEASGGGGRRQGSSSLVGPGRSGGLHGAPPPASGPSTTGEDGQALGRPTRAGLATGAPSGLTGPSVGDGGPGGGEPLRAAVPDILMSLRLGPHRVAERGEGLALVQAHSGGREAEDLEAPPQGPVTAQDKVWLVSPGSWLGPGSGQAGALSGTALLSPRRAGRRLSGQNCAEWRGPTGHRAPGGRNRPRRSRG